MLILHPVRGTITNRRELTDEVFNALPPHLRLSLIAKGTILAKKANKTNSERYAKSYTYARKVLREQAITWGRTAYGIASLEVNHDVLNKLAAEKSVIRKVAALAKAA